MLMATSWTFATSGTDRLTRWKPAHRICNVLVALLQNLPGCFAIISFHRSHIHKHRKIFNGNNFLYSLICFTKIMRTELINFSQTWKQTLDYFLLFDSDINAKRRLSLNLRWYFWSESFDDFINKIVWINFCLNNLPPYQYLGLIFLSFVWLRMCDYFNLLLVFENFIFISCL